MAPRPSDNSAEHALFNNPAVGFAERVADAVSRLSLEEKIATLHQHVPALAQLGLGAFHTGKEALHGAGWDGPATTFPQAVGLGATWDPDLISEIGEAVGREIRAQHEADPLVSLVIWAPVVNLLRDPRWGRNEEGYSEDPFLTAELARAYCRGLVGERSPYLRVAPLLKHFLAYNREDDRATTDVVVRPRVMHEYELPAFLPAIADGSAAGVMPSYNLVNGRPAHLTPEINQELRRVGGEDLLVCSDAWAPSNIVDLQHYAPDHPTSHAWALLAGVDSFTDKDASSSFTTSNVAEALQRQLVSEADVERAAGRVLLARLRTGELDPDGGPFSSDGSGQLCSEEHAALAKRAAQASVVLLRNEDGLLPLELRSGDRLAVVGPLVHAVYTDWYSPTLPYGVSIADGLSEWAKGRGADALVSEAIDRVRLRAEDGATLGEYDVADWGHGIVTLRDSTTGKYLSEHDDGTLAADQDGPNGWVVHETFVREDLGGGTALLRNKASGHYVVPAAGGALSTSADRASARPLTWEVIADGAASAAQLAATATTTVIVVGNHPLVNGREAEDRPGIGFPDAIERLVEAVSERCARVVLLIMSSYPYALGPGTGTVRAMVWSSHAGQETGHALAAVLSGAAEPGGRIPQTWYASAADLPEITEYDIIKARSTYLYFDRQPLFPFGHGLTYTSFQYGPASASAPELDEGGTVSVRFELTNTGARTGTEVVQVYARPPAGVLDRPNRRLCGFKKVTLAPGETRAVELVVAAERLAYWDVGGHRMALDAGEHELAVGPSSADMRCGVKVVVPPKAPVLRSLLGEGLEAADFDDYADVRLVPASPLLGSAVAPSGDGPGWALFRNVDIGLGAHAAATPLQLGIVVARASSGDASLEVRVAEPGTSAEAGSSRGKLLASLTVPSTGGPYDQRELRAELAAGTLEVDAKGERGRTVDLYVVLRGEQRFSSVRLIAAGGQPRGL